MHPIDLNGDGHSEFVTLNSQGLVVLAYAPNAFRLAAYFGRGEHIGRFARFDPTTIRHTATGRFVDASRTSILLGTQNGIWLTSWSEGEGVRHFGSANHDSRLGEWRLNSETDRFGAAGDFDGDGTEELLVTSGWGLGILKYDGDGFVSLAILENDSWAGEWRLNTLTNTFGPIGDFDGDGTDEIMVSSPWGIGFLKANGSRIDCIGLFENQRHTGGLQNPFGWYVNSERDEYGPVLRIDGPKHHFMVRHKFGIAVGSLDGGRLSTDLDWRDSQEVFLNRNWDRFEAVFEIEGGRRDGVLISTPNELRMVTMAPGEAQITRRIENGRRARRSGNQGLIINTLKQRYGPCGVLNGWPVFPVSGTWGIGLLTVDGRGFASLVERKNGSRLGPWRVTSSNAFLGSGVPYQLARRSPADLTIDEPYTAPREPVLQGPPGGEYVPPAGLVDYWDWSRIDEGIVQAVVRTGRHHPRLRAVAAESDPMNALVESVKERLTNGSSPYANAFADLAVSGRESYAQFSAQRPMDDRVAAAVLAATSGHSRTAIETATRASLDRAYKVAWALRGDPDHRRRIRPELGWIAVSSEDDPPHAPTNIYGTDDYVARFNIDVPEIDQTVEMRTAVKVAANPPTGDMPDIAARELPSETIGREILNNINGSHFDRLILFIHGLGSRLEESGSYKRRLIESGLRLGTRFGVISVDVPGFGYSSRVNLADLLQNRQVGRRHGFSLPNGTGSTFPVLAFQRDCLALLSRQIRNGIQHVMGGSLGGNLTLWLAEEPQFGTLPNAQIEGVRSFASWAPASTWESYGRASSRPIRFRREPGQYFDIGKDGARSRAFERMREQEIRPRDTEWTSGDRNTRYNFFEVMQRGEALLFWHILGAWGHPPTKGGLLTQSELYHEQYRRYFWASAYEQVVFSHKEPLWENRWPYESIVAPLLICAGTDDVGESDVMNIYDNIKAIAEHTGIGERRWIRETGHSVSDQRSFHLADLVARYFVSH